MVLNSILLQDAAATGAGASGMSGILMMVVLIVIFYFFMIRPQSKKQKKIREFQEEWGRKRERKAETEGEDGVDGELSLEELSRGTGLSAEEIVLAQGSMKPVESIYQTVYESSDSSLQLIDQLAEKGETFDERSVNRTVLAESLERLEPRERQLIYCRYFKDMTQAATAAELGMTQVQVSRSEKKILGKLRKMFDD